MNILKTWDYFHKPDTVFLNLSYKLQQLPSQLLALDDRRKKVQIEILSLSAKTDICRTCPKSCCRGNYNHFTMVDFIIRIFSDLPINEIGMVNRPSSLFSSALIKYGFFKPQKQAGMIQQLGSRCPNLTQIGCSLSPEARPIRCVIYTCRSFRQSLPPDVIIKIGALTKELSSIAVQAVNLFS